MLPINNAVLKLSKRAETHEPQHIIDSFVDIGPVFTLLSNADNQVIFGRRGTGKTHLLAYLCSQLDRSGIMTAQLDMRTVGSTGGIYSDPNIPLSERATRLLVDTLIAIHDAVLGRVLEDTEALDLSQIGPVLDALAEAATELTVEGVVERESTRSSSTILTTSNGIKLGVGSDSLMSASLEDVQKSQAEKVGRIKVSGQQRLRVQFGRLSRELQRLVDLLPKKKLWVILDEWSEIPLDLQPYLADLFRRCVIPVRGITVKVAAIEQRSNFRIADDSVGHIGIEIGADAAASISLDEFLVFENSPEQAKQFFAELLYRHVSALMKAEGEGAPDSASDLIAKLFTQVTALEEFTRASEGVPRDAINIIGIAAQKSPNVPISVQDVRSAARTWYTRAKQQAISTKPEAQRLLNWVIDEVIKHRQAPAFLLEVGARDELIDFLYDARALHVIRQGISSQDHAGRRFNVYALDYGCYVDLINTSRAPKGLFVAEVDSEEEGGEMFVAVPHTDLRSIRRAILDLADFYKQQQPQPRLPGLE
ncbi:hypothetical protein ISN34_04005 [Xanthomonas translucens pv. translucens]|nr:hypothetical protein ISN31_14125 [Xanthomonas translucens pv. translucens]QSQ47195.1 hypothetical protein ISN34_04005 [Xanthomonas translucens pv. translucens]